MDWVETECHQFLAYQNDKHQRLVFSPIKNRVVEIVLDDTYGTRFLIPESNNFIQTTGTQDLFKHQMCIYLKDNLKVFSVNTNTNSLGKFCRFNFQLENTVYRIADLQYMI